MTWLHRKWNEEDKKYKPYKYEPVHSCNFELKDI